MKRETDNKSLHLKRSWFQKNILKNVSGSKHKKSKNIHFRFSLDREKLDVYKKKGKKRVYPELYLDEFRNRIEFMHRIHLTVRSVKVELEKNEFRFGSWNIFRKERSTK